MCTCEPYQQIIGMGEKALPFIYYELTTEPDHWFWALRAITCDDPVPDEHRGDIAAMTVDWLSWFKKRFDEGFWNVEYTWTSPHIILAGSASHWHSIGYSLVSTPVVVGTGSGHFSNF
jgi:hypothetical protein